MLKAIYPSEVKPSGRTSRDLFRQDSQEKQSLISSHAVLNTARGMYNCSFLIGAVASGTHWSSSFDLLMSPSLGLYSAEISPLTYAFLQDTGKFTVAESRWKLPIKTELDCSHVPVLSRYPSQDHKVAVGNDTYVVSMYVKIDWKSSLPCMTLSKLSHNNKKLVLSCLAYSLPADSSYVQFQPDDKQRFIKWMGKLPRIEVDPNRDGLNFN